jgi:predicted nucleotidyltransferase
VKERIGLLFQDESAIFQDMSKQEIVRTKREQILGIARKHGAVSMRLFGSAARGDEVEGSDLDFVVEMEPGRSLLDLGGLQVDLERLLGCPVDVVTVKGLRERIRARVMEEAVPV